MNRSTMGQFMFTFRLWFSVLLDDVSWWFMVVHSVSQDDSVIHGKSNAINLTNYGTRGLLLAG